MASASVSTLERADARHAREPAGGWRGAPALQTPGSNQAGGPERRGGPPQGETRGSARRGSCHLQCRNAPHEKSRDERTAQQRGDR
eukprot:5211252-Alexandrium_andersonii.AAC.1